MRDSTFGRHSMHYKIAPGVTIKTENAAKPESQGSYYLRKILCRLPPVHASFDYGCGKLRYCDALLETTDTLAIVDSEIQLSRVQTLRQQQTSIREVLRRSNRIAIYNQCEFKALRQKFDRGFCINVLPIIPLCASRKEVVDVIRSKLKRGGTCLFVVQYRNSDFEKMRRCRMHVLGATGSWLTLCGATRFTVSLPQIDCRRWW